MLGDVSSQNDTILGDGPGGLRVGVIALANDQLIERDLGRLLSPDILTYTTRIAFRGDCTFDQLAKMAPLITDATRLLNPEVALDAVVFGCTSGTIAIGPVNIRASVQQVVPGTIVVNPVDAACDAFAHLGARRINLVTPYEPNLANLIARTFAERGFDVVQRHDFGITESADISRVTPKAIHDAAASLATDDVDCTFVSCTDFQSLEVLAAIESATRRPVVSSNQAICWALRSQLGAHRTQPGFGRLLEETTQD